MPIKLTQDLIDKLAARGVSTLLSPGALLPDNVVLEPPCSLKWMQVQHSLHLDAFSYAVSGFYFGCRIGRYCSFGENVQIGRHPHPMHWFSTSPFFYQDYQGVFDAPPPDGHTLQPAVDFPRQAPPVQAMITTIGNDVWIGHGAFILPGVKVGDGAVIAAMSVVTKDVPPYAVVAGCPAQVKKYRFPEKRLERLAKSHWWDFAPWDLKGAPVDRFPAFFDFLAKIKSEGKQPYRPEKLQLSTLV
jgi:acetyltransferase-like isoleucine patch superfamily enzyme